MSKSKYNIGDKVLVREDLCSGKYYGEIMFVRNMAYYCNREATITAVQVSEHGQICYIIDNDRWVWSKEMFVSKTNTTKDDFLKNKRENNMPSIKTYKYNPEIALTTIEWVDGTKTTARAENPNEADPYTGFVTAVAKKACGNDNTINKLYDEWAIKKPAKELEKQILINNKSIEEKRIAEKRKAKKEKWLIHKEALRLKREYEAKKLAHEKYGIPFEDGEK